MKFIQISFIVLLTEFMLVSCGTDPRELLQQYEGVEKEPGRTYELIYATAAFLATTRSMEPAEAIPLLNKMIALGYPTEARYCIDNLESNGIRSADLVALRGLCYQNELQSQLALSQYRRALEMEPGNEKIRILMENISHPTERSFQPEELLARAASLLENHRPEDADRVLDRILSMDELYHSALYMKGLIRLQQGVFDSAVYFAEFARSIEKMPEYDRFIDHIRMVKEGEGMIRQNPSTFRGYLLKSQGLSSTGLFNEAHMELDRGLERNPDNINLILAKALVWMQAGEPEMARQYLREQEQRGMIIDPAVKEQILQPENSR